MTTLLVQFVAFASSLMLLLPPGWCAGMPCCQSGPNSPVAAEQPLEHSVAASTSSPASSVPARSCCLAKKHAVAEERPAEVAHENHFSLATTQGSAPDCCCVQGKPVTERVVSVHLVDSLSLTPAATVQAVECGQLPRATEASPPFAQGPRIHLLHSVWRC